MAKTIVFCADGTWNAPDQDDNKDGAFDPTNVWKLFQRLEGVDEPGTALLAKEQEKVLTKGGAVIQIAKYIHGVGDSRNPLVNFLGGALGAGTIARIVRGYTFISRHYEPGDRIVTVGFSRGAYTARALADFIITKGLLKPGVVANREDAYRKGAAAWYAYRQAKLENKGRHDWLRTLKEAVLNLPGFLATSPPEESFQAVPKLAAVAVWDTVGALGIPHYKDGTRLDSFQFTGDTLNDNIERGIHAVAMDEQRGDFRPALWQRRKGVTQTLFPGAHADVGGGYPSAGNQSDLSDIALEWMIEQLDDIVRIAPTATTYAALKAKAVGVAHTPWTALPWPARPTMEREFCQGKAPTLVIPLHPSIQDRTGQIVQPTDPKEGPTYVPTPCRKCDVGNPTLPACAKKLAALTP